MNTQNKSKTLTETEKQLSELLKRFLNWSTRIPHMPSPKLTNDLAGDRDAATDILIELGFLP